MLLGTKIFGLLCLFPLLALSQWANIPTPGYNVIMTSDSTGYCADAWKNCPSYACGYSSAIYQTSNDWQTHNGFSYIGGTNGCCSLFEINFFNDSNIIVVYDDQGTAMARNFKNGQWQSTNYSIGNVSDKRLFFADTLLIRTKKHRDSIEIFYEGARISGRILSFDSAFTNVVDIERDQLGNCYLILANSNRRHLLRSSNLGFNWSNNFSTTTSYLNNIVFTANNRGFMSSIVGKVFHSLDSGRSWNQISQINNYINAIEFSNDSVGIIGSDSGKVYITNDYGQNWIMQQVNTNQPIIRIQFISDDIAYIEDGIGNLFKNSTVTAVSSIKVSRNIDVEIYPNPSNGLIHIINKLDQYSSYDVYNISGKLIKSGLMKGIESIRIDSLLPGIYLIKLSGNSGFVTKKIIVE